MPFITLSTAVVAAALHTYIAAPQDYLCDTRLMEAQTRMAKFYAETDKEDLCKGNLVNYAFKDVDAAKRLKMSVGEYVVLGARPELIIQNDLMLSTMEQKDGIKAGPSSIYRDDPRQEAITCGTRSRPGYSYHGGSKVTRGFGDGQAIDIKTRLTGLSLKERVLQNDPIWQWIDKHGKEFNLCRVYLRFDSPHVGLCNGEEYRTRHPGILARIAAGLKRFVHRVKASFASAHGHKKHHSKQQVAFLGRSHAPR